MLMSESPSPYVNMNVSLFKYFFIRFILPPDIVIIFAWNLKREIAYFLNQIFTEDVRILTLIPEISFLKSFKEGQI